MRYLNSTPRKPTTETINPPKEIREQTAARRAWLAARLAEIQAEGRDAKIVGTGSYQSISIKLPRETKTVEQMRGVCQVCGGTWAVRDNGSVVHHGYERPGFGWQTASCYGAGEPTIEFATARAEWYRNMLAIAKQEAETRLAMLNAPECNEVFVVEKRDYRTNTMMRREISRSQGYEWSYQHTVEVQATASKIRHLGAMLIEIAERIAASGRGEYQGTTRLYTVAK